jgi:hypothetical protein
MRAGLAKCHAFAVLLVSTAGNRTDSVVQAGLLFDWLASRSAHDCVRPLWWAPPFRLIHCVTTLTHPLAILFNTFAINKMPLIEGLVVTIHV